jgi:gamma-glutamyltranspeptidase / glutathione hydrolase
LFYDRSVMRLRTLAPFALLVVAACAAAPPRPAPAPAPGAAPTKAAPPYAAASENEQATKAAMAAMARGGSAVDGAIAAALVAGVVVPVSSGIGGGGFAMIHDPKTQKTTILDFRETAPQALDPEALQTKDAKGGVWVGTPGEVAGLVEMHGRWGKRPFAENVEEAATIAEKGFTASPHMAKALKRFAPYIEKAGIGARLPMDGRTVTAKELGATLRGIAAKGKGGFYEGAVAASFVETAQRAGSTITLDDFKAYQVLERTPLQTTWGDHAQFQILTMPPPSAGGLTVMELLGTYSRSQLAGLGIHTTEGIHELAELFRGVLADRFSHVGDPDRGGHDVGKLLDPARLKARHDAIKPNETRPVQAFVTEDHGTHHLVVVDREGLIVSMTTTVNNPFGARIVDEKTGVYLNDELMDFTSDRITGPLGIKSPGRARPGARPPSSMTPTIIFRDGKPAFAFGGSGGMRIATGVAQVAAMLVSLPIHLDQAIARPRIHVIPDGTILVEKGALTADQLADLEKRGEKVREEDNGSGITGIEIDRSDPGGEVRLLPGADQRKFGFGEAAR